MLTALTRYYIDKELVLLKYSLAKMFELYNYGLQEDAH